MAKRITGLIIKMRQHMNRTPNEKSARLAFLILWSERKAKYRDSLHNKETRVRFNRMSRPKKHKVAACWVCRAVEALCRHHIIQVQHGGSNWDLNIVRICDRCHAEIHPWLDAPPLKDDPLKKNGPIPF